MLSIDAVRCVVSEIPMPGGLPLVAFIQEPIAALMDSAKVDPATLTFLIHTHTATVIAPFGTSIIRQIKHNLQCTAALAFGSTALNCAAGLSVLDLADTLLQGKPHAKGIVVTGEFPVASSMQSMSNTPFKGAGVSAVLLSLNGQQNRLCALHVETFGAYAKQWLEQDVAQRFQRHCPDLLAGVIQQAVHKAGITLREVAWILPHNAHAWAWPQVARILNVPLATIYVNNVNRYGHCFGADPWINLASMQQDEQIQPKQFIVLATVGIGATIAAAVFQH